MNKWFQDMFTLLWTMEHWNTAIAVTSHQLFSGNLSKCSGYCTRIFGTICSLILKQQKEWREGNYFTDEASVWLEAGIIVLPETRAGRLLRRLAISLKIHQSGSARKIKARCYTWDTNNQIPVSAKQQKAHILWKQSWTINSRALVWQFHNPKGYVRLSNWSEAKSTTDKLFTQSWQASGNDENGRQGGYRSVNVGISVVCIHRCVQSYRVIES